MFVMEQEQGVAGEEGACSAKSTPGKYSLTRLIPPPLFAVVSVRGHHEIYLIRTAGVSCYLSASDRKGRASATL